MHKHHWMRFANLGLMRTIDGGTDGGGSAPDGGADTQPNADGQEPPAQPKGDGSDSSGDDKGNGNGLPTDVDTLHEMIRGLREENGSERKTAKANAAKEARDEMIQEFGKLLGFVKDDNSAPTVEDLTSLLAKSEEASKTSAVELAIYRGASEHQGDVSKLSDSRSFMDAVAKIDQSADDFQSQVTAAAKKAVEANSALRAVSPSSASSADHPRGSGENASPTQDEFNRMTPGQKQALHNSDIDTYRRLSGRA